MTHSPSALIRAIRTRDRDLSAREAKVAKQSASTAAGMNGRRDIVTGLKLIVGSNRTPAKELQRASAHQPLSQAKLRAASRADVKGNADLNAGVKLLALGQGTGVRPSPAGGPRPQRRDGINRGRATPGPGTAGSPGAPAR